jgi:hypothetical protein
MNLLPVHLILNEIKMMGRFSQNLRGRIAYYESQVSAGRAQP